MQTQRTIAEERIYPASFAAALLARPSSTVRRWAGDDTLSMHAKGKRLSFRELVSCALVAELRSGNISLRVIRQAVVKADELYGLPAIIASRAFLQCGNEILLDEGKVGPRTGEWVNPVNDQVVLKKLVESYARPLKLYVDYGETWAKRLIIAEAQTQEKGSDDASDRIIIDPTRRFGEPCIESTGHPVVAIAEYLQAGESVENLAEEFGIKLHTLNLIKSNAAQWTGASAR